MANPHSAKQQHDPAQGDPPASRDHRGGRMIEPLRLEGNTSVADMIDHVYANSGFNGRRLAEACHLFSHMLKENSTIALTLAGAMTPIGMSGPIMSLIEKGFIDLIISTGANLYHDMHRPFDCPMYQGHFAVDDDELAREGIARIYDTYIEDERTLLATDRIVRRAAERLDRNKQISTARLHYALGQEILETAPHPEKSLVATAATYELPIYTSSPGDSSIAMNLIVPHVTGQPILLDPLRDILETTAVVFAAEKNGVVEIGGGSPKNFYLQTQPTLWQILGDESKKGHDYFIQFTTDSPHWGGLSGATPQEAKSWGKVKEALINNVVVYSDASITFPILCQYVLMKNQPREPKRLFREMPEMVERLIGGVPAFAEYAKGLGRS
jgi:deoxyhypusine synthase